MSVVIQMSLKLYSYKLKLVCKYDKKLVFSNKLLNTLKIKKLKVQYVKLSVR